MLKGIDPLLNADALAALRAMGHGDDLIVADANFPAAAVARDTVFGTLIRMDCDAPRALAAIVSVMPVDDTVKDALGRMESVNADAATRAMQQAAEDTLARAGSPRQFLDVERFDFYDRARRAFAVIQTAERRFYGCFALRKGVIAPES